MSDCKHEDLKCRKCMRNGDIKYFVKKQAEAEGWEIFDHNEHVTDRAWEELALMVHDWVEDAYPDEVANGLIDLDYELVIFVRKKEDANDAKEEGCTVPEGIPYIPVGNLSV